MAWSAGKSRWRVRAPGAGAAGDVPVRRRAASRRPAVRRTGAPRRLRPRAAGARAGVRRIGFVAATLPYRPQLAVGVRSSTVDPDGRGLELGGAALRVPGVNGEKVGCRPRRGNGVVMKARPGRSPGSIRTGASTDARREEICTRSPSRQPSSPRPRAKCRASRGAAAATCTSRVLDSGVVRSRACARSSIGEEIRSRACPPAASTPPRGTGPPPRERAPAQSRA